MARKKSAPDQIEHALDRAIENSGRQRRCDWTFDKFFRAFPPAPNYMWGPHTKILLAELQKATEAVERGGTYYVIISIPPRHGKSDITSRRYPAFHLCRNPDHEVILTSYNSDVAEYLGRSTRRCFEEAGARWGLRFADDQNQLASWGIQGHRGGMHTVGLGAGITGKGAHVLVVDDYYKNREEAESETVRQNRWDSFRSDLMTRLAPAHAVIVVATRWHEHDLVASILEEQKREPDFPKFKLVNCPAQNEDGTYLFVERFGEQWYRRQRAAVGAYAWQSLYQGDPKPRTGALLRADLAAKIRLADWPKGLLYARGWDLASTAKERVKDDPDYTVGTKAGFHNGKLWVVDVKRGQWSAPTRDKIIRDTAIADGPGVSVRIECVAGYKDTYDRIRSELFGLASVKKLNPEGDKVARASVFEPFFEAGNVCILEAPWNDPWLAEFLSFPKGAHDDCVDSLHVTAAHMVTSRGRMSISS